MSLDLSGFLLGFSGIHPALIPAMKPCYFLKSGTTLGFKCFPLSSKLWKIVQVCVLLHFLNSQTSFSLPRDVHLRPLPVSPQLFPPTLRVTGRCCYTKSLVALLGVLLQRSSWFGSLSGAVSCIRLAVRSLVLSRPFVLVLVC